MKLTINKLNYIINITVQVILARNIGSLRVKIKKVIQKVNFEKLAIIKKCHLQMIKRKHKKNFKEIGFKVHLRSRAFNHKYQIR
jgi:hypothetical protein